MFNIIELAARLGKLEARVEALEKKRPAEGERPAPAAGEAPARRDAIQEWMEGIMSYQGPVKKGGDEG